MEVKKLNNLLKYGVTDQFIIESRQYKGLTIARVITQYKGLYKIATIKGECLAEISGKLNYQISDSAHYPAVGDVVMVEVLDNHFHAIIHNILTRKSAFFRTAVGTTGQLQMIATNIDLVFICMSLNNNYSLNRLERYLSIAWDSGAVPIIVLTKSDLCENLQDTLQEVENIAPFTDVIVTSIFDKTTLEQVGQHLKEGVTGAFVGSSGVGKSTLINMLLGEDDIETQQVGKLDKGKHTTTNREIFPTIYGGVVIDTPGMREIGVDSADLSNSFTDIESLASQCKYRNCTHTSEQYCAIKKALEEGLIDQRRFDSYVKIKIESGYEGLSSKQIEVKKLERIFKEVGGMKNVRNNLKEHHKRR